MYAYGWLYTQLPNYIPNMLYHLAIPLILGFCCVWHIAASAGSKFLLLLLFLVLVLVYLASLLGVQWLSNSDSSQQLILLKTFLSYSDTFILLMCLLR